MLKFIATSPQYFIPFAFKFSLPFARCSVARNCLNLKNSVSGSFSLVILSQFSFSFTNLLYLCFKTEFSSSLVKRSWAFCKILFCVLSEPMIFSKFAIVSFVSLLLAFIISFNSSVVSIEEYSFVVSNSGLIYWLPRANAGLL